MVRRICALSVRIVSRSSGSTPASRSSRSPTDASAMILLNASVVIQKPPGTRTPSIRDNAPRCAPLPPTTATCVSSASSRSRTYCSVMAIPPRLPCSVVLRRPVASPAPPTLSNRLSSTSSSLVPSPPTSRAASIPAAPPRALAAALPAAPLIRRHRVPRTRATTHALVLHFRRLWHRPMILHRDPGLAASPPTRYKLSTARRDLSPCLCRFRCLDTG